MTKSNPLTQLKDIHLPDPVGWWPIACGWYVLSGLSLCLLIAILRFIKKRRRDALARNKALILLDLYQRQYEKELQVAQTSALVSELLRRVALIYFPRADIASLHGEVWVQFLNKTAKGVDFNSVREALLEAPFQRHSSLDLQPLFYQTKLWIKQRKAPCLN